MYAGDLSGTVPGFVGQAVGELGAQFLQEPETLEAGATRSVLAEVVWTFWVDMGIKQGRIKAHQDTFRLGCPRL